MGRNLFVHLVNMFVLISSIVAIRAMFVHCKPGEQGPRCCDVSATDFQPALSTTGGKWGDVWIGRAASSKFGELEAYWSLGPPSEMIFGCYSRFKDNTVRSPGRRDLPPAPISQAIGEFLAEFSPTNHLIPILHQLSTLCLATSNPMVLRCLHCCICLYVWRMTILQPCLLTNRSRQNGAMDQSGLNDFLTNSIGNLFPYCHP
jgi:hypothetical protein